ncbi:MAG: M23 family metallopeptidase [Pelolinea sp.]|jgi:murein DD-endopeptidase MepM/ murein hydrolase activator NlpD|nr:M23 family metallopeptidase [Pelolinea sp.]
MKKIGKVLLIGLGIMIVVVCMVFYETIIHPQRSSKVVQFLRNPEEHTDWAVKAQSRCQDAPFLLPTDGLIGYLWGDSFRIGKHHQGIDIFGGTEAGITPVYAAYDGYLTRLPDWKSSLIIRIPDDPLQPGRQIWTYYTHMADKNGKSYIAADFPPGTSEVFVKAGTLLGYQGNYSGSANNPVGVHLHFSIVLSDSEGNFENELEIGNTLDPSPYFNLPLNGKENKDIIPVCSHTP